MALRKGDLQKMCLLPEPHFSSSIQWGQTGKTWTRASHPGVLVSHALFPAPMLALPRTCTVGKTTQTLLDKGFQSPIQSGETWPRRQLRPRLSDIQPARGQFPGPDGQTSTPGAGEEGWTHREHKSTSLCPSFVSEPAPHSVASY